MRTKHTGNTCESCWVLHLNTKLIFTAGLSILILVFRASIFHGSNLKCWQLIWLMHDHANQRGLSPPGSGPWELTASWVFSSLLSFDDVTSARTPMSPSVRIRFDNQSNFDHVCLCLLPLLASLVLEKADPFLISNPNDLKWTRSQPKVM